MKRYIVFPIISVMALVSCGKGEENHNHERHNHEEEKSEIVKPDLSNVKVINEIDPICEMETKDHTNDTMNYKGQVYGFCSTHCKNEFKKDPEKYISILNKK